MDGDGADGRTAGDWNSCSLHLPGSGWWNWMEAWTRTAVELVTPAAL